jgi:transcriptional regulator with XRE-family HTH domain
LCRLGDVLTPAQCRAARGLLDWTQQELAQKAGLGIVTVRQLEAGTHEPRRLTLDVVRRAFERAGVEFIDEDGGGAGVRLRKPHRSSARVSHGIASEDNFAKGSGDPDKIIMHEPNRIKKNLVITAEQLRAARGLLGWSQPELAARAGLSVPTVKRVESKTGPRVSDEARTRLRKALESAGVGFTDENGGGVYLRKRCNTRK